MENAVLTKITARNLRSGHPEFRPGDTIRPEGIVKSKQLTKNSRLVLIDVMVRNHKDEKVATGEAMVEFPLD